MKRFWLFGGHCFFDCLGGMDDFHASFDSIEDLLLSGSLKMIKSGRDPWYQIYDAVTNTILPVTRIKNEKSCEIN